ncbi:MAG: uncharacterized membrane protein YgdD (TMEM256/DUF423 family) [Phenylobacterium sp.]|jgi:uncharacterized membrane protein YgdD (TMEM256/DUF423 family)
MMKIILLSGIFFALLSVVLGAFGAHGLKSKISADMLAVFQTGVQYQFYHGLGLLILGLLIKQMPSTLLLWSGGSMVAGIVCFSGSLYLLALTGNKIFGPITPLGGLFFIIAWVLMFVAVLKADL